LAWGNPHNWQLFDLFVQSFTAIHIANTESIFIYILFWRTALTYQKRCNRHKSHFPVIYGFPTILFHFCQPFYLFVGQQLSSERNRSQRSWQSRFFLNKFFYFSCLINKKYANIYFIMCTKFKYFLLSLFIGIIYLFNNNNYQGFVIINWFTYYAVKKWTPLKNPWMTLVIKWVGECIESYT